MIFSRGTLHPVTGETMTAKEYNELAIKHGWEVMPEWEAVLRDKLEVELPDGAYQLGGLFPGDIILHTGKGGQIEFEVAMRREFIKAVEATDVPKVIYKPIPYDKFTKVVGDFLFKKK